MNNIILTKVKNGKGWYLDVEDVIFRSPLTALELLTIAKMIEDNREELEKEVLETE